MARTIINPDGLADIQDRFHYNYVVVEDGMLYHSGQVGRDADGNHVTESFEAQARQAYENVELILNLVNKEFGDVNKFTTYLTNIGRDGDTYREVRDEFLEEPYPSATLIGVDSLSFDDLWIELEAEVQVSEEDIEEDVVTSSPS
jgi:2-iminobutanoate/2-iminopropanoate deaminase